MKKYLLILILSVITFQSYLHAQTLYPITEGINPSGSYPEVLLKLRNHVYLFTAISVDHGRELYVTDGNQSGTFLVKDINPGAGSSVNSILYWISDSVCVFSANDGINNQYRAPWRSDGTASGTYLLYPLISGPTTPPIFTSDVVTQP